jgi:two-component system OmpR family response regulator
MTHETHILLVEDDKEISYLVARYLRANQCRVSVAVNGQEADRILADHRVDLVVLDIMLPGEDGLSICRRLRDSHRLPIILVSAKSDEIDRIVGLEIGADDYVGKPFNPRELLARIRAVLRRTAGMSADPARPVTWRTLTFNGWTVDTLHRSVTNPGGVRVMLTGAEFDLLLVFCERSQRVLSRDQLLEFTQGRTAAPFERSVDILVSRLRRKIEGDGPDEVIKTIRSAGYLFTPAVEAA